MAGLEFIRFPDIKQNRVRCVSEFLHRFVYVYSIKEKHGHSTNYFVEFSFGYNPILKSQHYTYAEASLTNRRLNEGPFRPLKVFLILFRDHA